MTSQADEQNTIRQYLLGQLPPAQRPALEERLLTDEAFYEELLIVEDELIDQYLTGRVFSATERASFESVFLVTPERQAKLRFARVLRRCVAKGRGAVEGATEAHGGGGEAARTFPRKLTLLPFLPARNPAFALSLAAAALLLCLAGYWVWMRGPGLRQEPRHVLAVTLSPGLARADGEMTKVRVNRVTDEIHFRLGLEAGEYPSYRVALLTAEGATVLTGENLKPESSDSGRVVIFRASPQSVPPGDYQLKLSGVHADGTSEGVGSYPFRVLRGEP